MIDARQRLRLTDPPSTSDSEQLRVVRLEMAEALLVDTDLKIEAIALRVGFGTESRTSTSLRRDRSMTASKLRAGHR
jgi:transcriptional regulator GlxA family with amidase domain